MVDYTGYVVSVNTDYETPQPPSWTWALGPWNGPLAVELRRATNRKVTFNLLEPSEASFSIVGDSADAEKIQEYVSDLWLYRDGVPLYRGRVNGATDTIGETTYDVAVSTVDYRGLLERRLLYTDQTFTSEAQEDIVWALLEDAQAQNGGDLGIVRGDWPATGVTRASVELRAGDSVWQSISTLAGMTDGFEFDIDTNLRANLYYPTRSGVDRGAVLDYGGAVIKATGQTKDGSYANALRQSGADGVTPATREAADLGSRPEGRWDVMLADTSLTTSQMVSDRADFHIAAYSDAHRSWSLTLRPGGWRGPAHIWLGDVVTYAIKRGRMTEVRQGRVYSIDVALDQVNQETVTIVIDKPRESDPKLIKRIARKVLQAEKR